MQAAVTTLSQQTDTVLGTTGPVREERLSAPDRIVVHDDLGPVATFTFGSRTVTLHGPQRTFIEATTTTMGD